MNQPASNPNDPLLADLTEPQRQAVTHVTGPLLVLAGAGSGKTRVITRRIAHLVLRVGIAPWNVLAITFTNKAAGEMRERVATMMTERQSRAVTVATFHSLCARVIRRYADRLGLPPGYSIYDTSDQEKAVKQALSTLELSTGNFPPSRVLSAISSAKNELVDPEAYTQQARDFYSKNVARAYRKYQDILRANNALDFDDLLMMTVQLVRKHPDVLAQLQDHYQYILIDEYQDTNHAQFVIASALAAGHKNICATGDPDQSIYGWRGASIRNILEFEEHYPAATVVRLEQNYRSTKRILQVADKLIANNQQRKPKRLWTENETGELVRVVTCLDERHEAAWLVEHFRKCHDELGIEWRDMAVFYRINSLSRVIEDAFRNSGVPYQIARGTAFYERKEIKDAVGYLRLIVNPADEVNLTRVLNTPARGISDSTAKSIQAQAVAMGLSMFDVMQRPEVLGAISSRAAAAVAKFTQRVRQWRKTAGLDGETSSREEPSLRNFVDDVIRDSGLHGFYAKDKTDPDMERLANLGELVSSAQQFEVDHETVHAGEPAAMLLARKIEGYLEQVSLVSDVDSINTSQGAVTLMTMHAAKGLEFGVVGIVGVEEGLIPHNRANTNPSELEEERRLCFVGITRAMRFLRLTNTRYRTIFGRTIPTIPSRFIREMPSDALEMEDATDDDHGLAPSIGSSSPGGASLPRNALVRHPQFGLGRVMMVTGAGPSARAQVKFNTAGIKTLILQYAPLELVEM